MLNGEIQGIASKMLKIYRPSRLVLPLTLLLLLVQSISPPDLLVNTTVATETTALVVVIVTFVVRTLVVVDTSHYQLIRDPGVLEIP